MNKWIETTDPNSPLTKLGEWTWKQPWLEGPSDKNTAQYTVCLEDWHRITRWYATWWHGNRGYHIGHAPTLEEAKEVCVRHKNAMLEKAINS